MPITGRRNQPPFSSYLFLCRREVERFRGRAIDPRDPKRATKILRSWRGASQLEPTLVLSMSLGGVNKYVTVAIVVRSFGHGHLLVPTVLSAHRVRLDGKNQILMHTRIFPVNAR